MTITNFNQKLKYFNLTSVESLASFLDLTCTKIGTTYTISDHKNDLFCGCGGIVKNDLKQTIKNLLHPVNSILTKNQKVSFNKTLFSEKYNCTIDICCNIRFDDQCGNGHNSFGITGGVYESGKKRCDKNVIAYGCVHDDIILYFPEFSHLIKYHLVSSDCPMHYIANTLYHSRTTDTKGKKAGDPIRFNEFLKFDNIPFTFSDNKGLFAYIKNIKDFSNLEIEEIVYDGEDSYNYNSNYSLTGFDLHNASGKWYQAPFKNKKDAEEFLQALQNFKHEFIQIPTAFCNAVLPDLKAAHNSACWELATLDQLQNENLLEFRKNLIINNLKFEVVNLGMKF